RHRGCPRREGRGRARADHARAERGSSADGDPGVDRPRDRRDADRRDDLAGSRVDAGGRHAARRRRGDRGGDPVATALAGGGGGRGGAGGGGRGGGAGGGGGARRGRRRRGPLRRGVALLRRLFGRNGRGAVDWLIVGLGNPGREHANTRHNVGFMVAEALAERWRLGPARRRFAGLLLEGRVVTGGAEGRPRARRVALLRPQTYMNEAGRSVGPARGAFKLPPERVLVVHDEIDLPFGEVRARTGGGLAGHNGLRSVSRE